MHYDAYGIMLGTKLMKTNAQLNKAFLACADAAARDEVLQSIATHYGISIEQVVEEVTAENAEHLTDYLTGPIQHAVYLVMKETGLVQDQESTDDSRDLPPEVGSIVEYGLNSFGTSPARYRVNAYLREVVEVSTTDEFGLSEILQEARRASQGKRLRWCLREDATHLSLSGISGALAPVRDCKVIGMVDWPQKELQAARDYAERRGREGDLLG